MQRFVLQPEKRFRFPRLWHVALPFSGVCVFTAVAWNHFCHVLSCSMMRSRDSLGTLVDCLPHEPFHLGFDD